MTLWLLGLFGFTFGVEHYYYYYYYYYYYNKLNVNFTLEGPEEKQTRSSEISLTLAVDGGWVAKTIPLGRCVVEPSWNVMAHGDSREGKWSGNWRMEWVASTLHTTSEYGVSSSNTADAHTSATSSRLNWRPRRFKWTRPFRRKTNSGFCTCAITFQTQSTSSYYTYTPSPPPHSRTVFLFATLQLSRRKKIWRGALAFLAPPPIMPIIYTIIRHRCDNNRNNCGGNVCQKSE